MPGNFVKLNVSCCTVVITLNVCVCVVQVDTSAANSTSEGLMWLRLVQSARDKEEQNLEAYVKNGQLFYRSLRRIEKDEELLVWYGKDLIDLLLLSSSRAPAKSKGESVEITSLVQLCCSCDGCLVQPPTLSHYHLFFYSVYFTSKSHIR